MNRLRGLRMGRVLPFIFATAFPTLPAAQAYDPPQHFVVVMAADPAPEYDPQGLGVFQAAESKVYDLLFKWGEVIPQRRWYRFGIDSMTIIESGPGPKPWEAAAAAKGKWTLVAFDYARPITRPAIKIRQSRFAELWRSSHRIHQFDSDLTLAASKSLWMTPRGASEPIRLIVLRQTPSRPVAISGEVAAHFDEERREFALTPKTQAWFPYSDRLKFVVETADLVPGPSVDASTNPKTPKRDDGRFSRVLGIAFTVLKDLAFAGLAAWAARWVWIQRTRARHFEMWIPGFARAFPLPALHGSKSAGFRARLPRYSGEPAAHLELPGRTIRVLFCSGVVLRWDERLRVDGVAPSVTECSVMKLPRFVRFVWVERPAEQGNLSICIERPRMLGGNDRISIDVSFLALPQSDPEP
jgi:hypothetical protein